jgi:hypothetical protein
VSHVLVELQAESFDQFENDVEEEFDSNYGDNTSFVDMNSK